MKNFGNVISVSEIENEFAELSKSDKEEFEQKTGQKGVSRFGNEAYLIKTDKGLEFKLTSASGNIETNDYFNTLDQKTAVDLMTKFSKFKSFTGAIISIEKFLDNKSKPEVQKPQQANFMKSTIEKIFSNESDESEVSIRNVIDDSGNKVSFKIISDEEAGDIYAVINDSDGKFIESIYMKDGNLEGFANEISSRYKQTNIEESDLDFGLTEDLKQDLIKKHRSNAIEVFNSLTEEEQMAIIKCL